MTGMPKRRKDRLIGCQDLAGLRRELIVLADFGRVVLIAPRAKTAVLTPERSGRHCVTPAGSGQATRPRSFQDRSWAEQLLAPTGSRAAGSTRPAAS